MRKLIIIFFMLFASLAEAGPQGSDGASQSIALSTTSAQSSALEATTWVDVTCTVECFICFGANPTATTTACRFVIGQTG